MVCQKIKFRLQLVQNAAVRVVKVLKKRDHVTQARKELHWLPVEARIKLNIITTTWKALNGIGPKYIKDMLSIKTGRAGLRSPKSIGDRAFCKTAPTLWNELSHELRLTEKLDTFKSRLKTKLYSTNIINK